VLDEKVKEVEEPVDEITGFDRCDRCGSQAYVLAKGAYGPLTFCKHHFEKYEKNIRNYSYQIVDNRDKINQKPDSSA